MYPWNVLEINETDNRKSIKMAYAKLLRQYRPDEHPQAFQEINQAYQHALQIIKNTAVNPPGNESSAEHNQLEVKQAFESPQYERLTEQKVELRKPTVDEGDSEWVKPLKYLSVDIEDIDLSNPNADSQDLTQLDPILSTQDSADEIEFYHQADEDDEFIEQQIDDLFKQTHEMAFSPMNQRSVLKNWLFLDFFNEIHNIQLRDQLAKEMFRRVAEYNLFQKKQNKVNLIPSDVMAYMNELFQWEANWQEYSHIFPEHYIKSNFDGIEQNKGGVSSLYRPRLYTRSVALIVDFFAFFFLMGLLASFIKLDFINGGWFYFSMALFRLSTEMISPHRNSLGVMYLNYRFLDHYLNKPSRRKVLQRFAWFEISMLPVYAQFYLVYSNQSDWLFLHLYVAAILVFAYFRKGQLPHDLFSNTVAVRK